MNVGDYVRTNLKNEIVIRKVIDIIHSTSMNDNRMVFDKPTKFTYYVEDNENYKSSPQIIDLIEENDLITLTNEYCKGEAYRVIGKLKGIVELDLFEDGTMQIGNDDIKTIVTHEQMEAMQYRVEE